MRILVTGGRDWKNKQTVYEAINNEISENPTDDEVIVTGACPTGADHYAEWAANIGGVAIEKHPADWKKHGRRAGPIRNALMVGLGADVCLAFDSGGPGTRNCIGLARKAGIPVKVFTEDD